MTAPRWIAEAIEAVTATVRGGEVFQDIPIIDAERLPAALIEHLPLEAMVDAIAVLPSTREACISLVAKVVNVLTDGDPEVVELTALYQNACRVLDEAGVPYASSVDELGGMVTIRPAEALDLADRIRWLAQQRPIRAELESAQATRKLAEETATKYMAERNSARSEAHTLGEFLRAAHEELTTAGVAKSPTDSQHMMDSSLARRVRALRDERDQLQKMYECASDDLDRERSAHQEAEGAAANREIALTVDLENARRETSEHASTVTKLMRGIHGIVESDLPAGDLRRALSELIGIAPQRRRPDDVLGQLGDGLHQMIRDQAAYIEQLELEIEALEDQIDSIDRDPNLPDCWTGCEVGAP